MILMAARNSLSRAGLICTPTDNSSGARTPRSQLRFDSIPTGLRIALAAVTANGFAPLSPEFHTMINTTLRFAIALFALVLATSAVKSYPKPSPYPVSWDLKFDYHTPKRLVVRSQRDREPEAFWYMTFTVTNLTGAERNFFPYFELLGNDDVVYRSDNNIPVAVLETIRIKERNPRIEGLNDIAGKLRIGEDQARDGVAIWREPSPKMGRFSIFVSGTSGESVILKDDKGNPIERLNPEGKKSPVVLWKTLQLDYHLPADEKNPGNDILELVEQQWIMR